MTSYNHSFALPHSIEQAFHLFTPRGEEQWVPDWRPDYIDPPSGDAMPEMVFRTGAGEDETIWTCLVFDPRQHHARYLRVTPASRIAFVDVRCRRAAGGTNVSVQYRFVPVTGHGKRYLQEMDADRFASMIGGWRDLIVSKVPVSPLAGGTPPLPGDRRESA